MGRREMCHPQEFGCNISRYKRWSHLPSSAVGIACFELIAVFPQGFSTFFPRSYRDKLLRELSCCRCRIEGKEF